MKWWQNILRKIARRFLVESKVQIVEATESLVDSALFEACVEVKKKFPELPDSVILAFREGVDDYVSTHTEKAIDDLIEKLSKDE